MESLMTRYYVRADGDDTASGTSDAAAWKSITQVRTALANKTVRNGDMLLFRKGDKFPGVIGALQQSGVPVQDNKLVIGAYGVGARPVIDSAKVCNTPGGWTLDSTNVWKIDLSATGIAAGAFTGNVNSNSVNTGFIKVNGVRYGNKKSTKAALAQQWDFFDEGTTGQYLYVYSTDVPTNLAADIRVAVSSTAITVANSVRIIGLHLMDVAGHGIRGDGSALDVGIYGNRIEGVGGSYLSNTTRYGNGIEAWVGSERWEVRGNQISDTYDVAMTMQGPITSSGAQGWKDCHWQHNEVWDCNQAFEVWSTVAADAVATAYGWVRCSYRHNTSFNAGNSWAYPYQAAGLGTHLLTYNFEAPADIDVAHNTFVGAKDNYYFRNTGDFKPAAGYKMRNNDIFLAPGTKVSRNQPQTIENAASWVADTQHDLDSRFYILPQQLNTLDDLQAFLAENAGYARGQLAALRDEVARSEADRAMLGSTIALTASTVTLTPTPGFWEVNPAYGPVTATLVGNQVFLSGAIRRLSTASSLSLTSSAVSVLTGLPASMQPTSRRKAGLWLLPSGADSSRVPGFIDQASAQNFIQVGAVATQTMTAGSGTIVFDGISYQI
jgi:hypothetical protein